MRYICLLLVLVSVGCKTSGVQQVYVPVSEDTYVRLQQLEAQRQRDANEYRASVVESYSRERSEIRRIQADLERDKLRVEADRQRDLQRSRDRMREDWRDQVSDARRDWRDVTRDAAPQLYKYVRREWRNRR